MLNIFVFVLGLYGLPSVDWSPSFHMSCVGSCALIKQHRENPSVQALFGEMQEMQGMFQDAILENIKSINKRTSE